MIHRAPFGSMERFIGVLIEHFAGAFPLWLSPVQVAVLSISEKTNEYAQKITQQLKDAGLRVEANLGSEKIGAKIRTATLEKVPYMLVVGEKEAAEGKAALRHRTEGDKGAIAIEQIVAALQREVSERK
jgi:threonyl-tRNA synthetase